MRRIRVQDDKNESTGWIEWEYRMKRMRRLRVQDE